jgi:hypothetical protein
MLLMPFIIWVCDPFGPHILSVISPTNDCCLTCGADAADNGNTMAAIDNVIKRLRK